MLRCRRHIKDVFFIIMEIRKKLPNSIRRFIRTQKAQIRCQFFDTKKQETEIAEMYKKLLQNPEKSAKIKEEVKEAEKNQVTKKPKSKK